MDNSPLGSSAHRIFQARILEWVAISFSGDLPDSGIEPGSPALQADSLLTELQTPHMSKDFLDSSVADSKLPLWWEQV